METKKEKSSVSIWVLLEHNVDTMVHSLLKVDLPNDLKESEEEVLEVKEDRWESIVPSKRCYDKGFSIGLSMVLFPERMLLRCPEMVELGRKIYIFGGITSVEVSPNKAAYARLVKNVYALDADVEGPCLSDLKLVKPLNYPKKKPCVFVADGMIYALGSGVGNGPPEGVTSGCFERYLPQEDCWQVLPDPPVPFFTLVVADWSEHATVVGRKVFIGSSLPMGSTYLVFHLDTLNWVEPADKRFPYGSLCVDNHLYHLRGGAQEWRFGALLDDFKHFRDPLHIVKRGPLDDDDDCTSICQSLYPEKDKSHPVATAADLECEGDAFFTHSNFRPWRQLLHLGGPFFCFLATSMLFDRDGDSPLQDYYSRGVAVKVFKEVPNGTTSQFRLLSSYFYTFRTPYKQIARHVRACVAGTAPSSWNEVPLKRNVENKSVAKTIKTNGYVHISKEIAQENALAAREAALAAREAALAAREAALAVFSHV